MCGISGFIGNVSNDKEKILIILDNKQPVIDDKNAYYLFKKYTSRVREYD